MWLSVRTCRAPIVAKDDGCNAEIDRNLVPAGAAALHLHNVGEKTDRNAGSMFAHAGSILADARSLLTGAEIHVRQRGMSAPNAGSVIANAGSPFAVGIKMATEAKTTGAEAMMIGAATETAVTATLEWGLSESLCG